MNEEELDLRYHENIEKIKDVLFELMAAADCPNAWCDGHRLSRVVEKRKY